MITRNTLLPKCTYSKYDPIVEMEAQDYSQEANRQLSELCTVAYDIESVCLCGDSNTELTKLALECILENRGIDRGEIYDESIGVESLSGGLKALAMAILKAITNLWTRSTRTITGSGGGGGGGGGGSQQKKTNRIEDLTKRLERCRDDIKKKGGTPKTAEIDIPVETFTKYSVVMGYGNTNLKVERDLNALKSTFTEVIKNINTVAGDTPGKVTPLLNKLAGDMGQNRIDLMTTFDPRTDSVIRAISVISSDIDVAYRALADNMNDYKLFGGGVIKFSNGGGLVFAPSSNPKKNTESWSAYRKYASMYGGIKTDINPHGDKTVKFKVPELSTVDSFCELMIDTLKVVSGSIINANNLYGTSIKHLTKELEEFGNSNGETDCAAATILKVVGKLTMMTTGILARLTSLYESGMEGSTVLMEKLVAEYDVK